MELPSLIPVHNVTGAQGKNPYWLSEPRMFVGLAGKMFLQAKQIGYGMRQNDWNATVSTLQGCCSG